MLISVVHVVVVVVIVVVVVVIVILEVAVAASGEKSSIGFLFLHGFTLRLSFLFIKRLWAWLLAIFAN